MMTKLRLNRKIEKYLIGCDVRVFWPKDYKPGFKTPYRRQEDFSEMLNIDDDFMFLDIDIDKFAGESGEMFCRVEPRVNTTN